ncbi:L-asparaginase [Enterococcus sp. PF1-24]|uniref:asparaginase n=1 Tax=unclassified Enterococcus TaxID=2608891 RepID=UPI0024760FBE|nr:MULTISPECIES: asparaginase [unclassified Enterococcus]MDH6365717.1 L-asparaginase [Enterococcus sp. PFB1-1]MDH6402825.1 L-asparaginase [Enterococcus sp. PF1-24]
MKKILVLHTGGTIAMAENNQTGSVSLNQDNPLLTAQVHLPAATQLVVEDIFNLPSPQITPAHMLQLKSRIQRGKADGFTGVVITHGTDTLEETAFFLDITVGQLLPIVVTGAMRSSNELGSDGLYNFESAIRVAACDEAKNKGVLVVMNDEIHTARYVTKTHTTNVATFRTPTLGPIGIITKHQIRFMQQLITAETVDIQAVDGIVPIVKAYAGMEGDYLNALAEMNISGLVIEGLGAGNLPPKTIPALKKILAKNIPILLVSRCFNGIAETIYAYEGGGQQLADLGVIFCNGINSQKARLKLLVALNSQLSSEDQRTFLQK